MRALAVYQLGLLCSLPFQGFQETCFKGLAFGNLQDLIIISSACTTMLPPPEFLSSITSTKLSEVGIRITTLPPDGWDRALDAIKDYDGALCQLANQLDPSSSGSKKLILRVRAEEGSEFPDPAAFLPQFSKVGILELGVTEL